MEILEHIAVLLDGLFITLALVWVGWGLFWVGWGFFHTIGVWPGGLGRDLINNGDSGDGGEADAGADSSGWDFGGGFDGFLW